MVLQTVPDVREWVLMGSIAMAGRGNVCLVGVVVVIFGSCLGGGGG